MSEEQSSSGTHRAATQTSSPSCEQAGRQSAGRLCSLSLGKGEGERGLGAGRSWAGGAELEELSPGRPAGTHPLHTKLEPTEERLSPRAANKTTAPTCEELQEPSGRALESSLPEMLLKWEQL